MEVDSGGACYMVDGLRTAHMPTYLRSRRAGPAAALVVLTALAYAPVLRAGFVWDDDVLVTTNPLLHGWQGLAGIWLRPGSTLQYYPLTFTSWWAQYHAWGLAPVGYHVVNVLLHGTSAAVLWLVLLHLGVPGAWTAAAVFALHPVHVESVAWVSELKNVQSGLFYLLAALAYLRWALREDATPRAWLYALSLVCFSCALLSKTVTCTLPAVLALVLWWKRGTVSRRQALGLVPIAAVGAVAASMTAWMERHYVGAAGDEWTLSFPGRFLVAGRALWFYATKLVWPSGLSFVYTRWTIDPGVWWQWTFPLAAAAVVVLLAALARRIGRGPLFAVLIFAVTLAPALGFADVYPMRYSFVADHFQYLASIALIVPLVAAATVTIRRIAPAAASPVAAVLLATLAMLVWRQARVYQTPETLWRATLARTPSAWMAHNNLGLVLQQSNRVDEAAAHFREATRLRPAYPEAIYNLGNVLAAQGRLAEAAEQYERALRLDDRFAVVHNNLGNVLVMLGRVAEGRRHYARALELDPGYTAARENLAATE
jgi:protein O-mannosyl-transferase